MRVEQIGNATLYCGNSLDILGTLVRFDAVVTDPPYGVMLGNVNNGQARDKKQQPYTSFTDNREYIINTVIPIIEACHKLSDRMIITPGNRNSFLYPEPDDIGVWYNPAGTGRGKWGYLLSHLILYYGKDPRAGKRATASSVSGKNDSVASIKNIDHPCPKPLKFTQWMVDKVSDKKTDTILDPFMGTGTTGMAATEYGRKFIGIEIEEKYFDIACRRIEEAQRQQKLFP